MTREGVRTRQAVRFILVMGSLGFLFCVCSTFSRQMLEELFDPGLSVATALDQPAGVVGSCTTSRAVPAASNEAASPALVGTPIAIPSTPVSADTVSELTRLARWGPGVVNDIAWSSRQNLVAIATAYGVTLYDSAFRLVRTLEQPAAVIRVVFSPDGRRLAWQESDLRVRIWQVDDGAPVFVTKPGGTLRPDVFGPHGEFVVLTDENPRQLRDAATGELIRVLPVPFEEGVEIIAFSRDGALFALAQGPALSVWDAGDERKLWAATAERNADFESLAFDATGTLLATGDRQGVARVWHARDGTPVSRVRINTQWIREVEFSPDGKYLAAVGADPTTSPLVVVRAGDGKVVAGTSWAKGAPAFSPDGRTIAFRTPDERVEFRESEGGRLLDAISGSDQVDAVAIDPAGTLVAAAIPGFVELRRIEDGLLRCTIAVGQSPVTEITFSPDGQLLATMSYGSVRLWRVADGTLAREVQAPDLAGTAVFSPDGTLLATGTGWHLVRLWNVADGRLVRTLDFGDQVSDIAFSPDGALIATGGHQTIRTWQMSGFRLLHEFKTGPIIGDLAFSPDGQSLAATAGNGVTTWNLATGEERFVTTGLSWPQEDVVFTPDGALVVSSGSDQSLRFWRATDGTLLRTLDAHRHTIYSNLLRFALPADGRFIVTGSSDGTIGIWGSPVP